MDAESRANFDYSMSNINLFPVFFFCYLSFTCYSYQEQVQS